MHRYRPYLPTLWWCVLGVGLAGLAAYHWEIPFWLLVICVIGIAWPSPMGQHIVINGGFITIQAHAEIRLPMKNITRICFSSMRVELEDERGFRVQSPIGWYSARQLDDIIAHIRRSQHAG